MKVIDVFKIGNKKTAKAVMLCVAGYLSSSAALSHSNAFANEYPKLAEITFDEASWAPDLLSIIDKGTMILPADTDFKLDPPPANDSEDVAKELDFLKEITKTERTPETMQRIEWENKGVAAIDIFTQEGLFLAGDNTKTRALIDMVDKDHSYFIMKYKHQFNRARPSQLAPDLELAIPNPRHAAYPSGHASQTYMVALILTYMDPENKDRYFAMAHDIAHRREIAGVHYPSDSAAGVALAQEVFDAFMALPVFQKKMEDTKITFVKPPEVAVSLYPPLESEAKK